MGGQSAINRQEILAGWPPGKGFPWLRILESQLKKGIDAKTLGSSLGSWRQQASQAVLQCCRCAYNQLALGQQWFEMPFTRQGCQQNMTTPRTGITMRNSFLILSFALVCVLAIGCDSPSATKSDGKADLNALDDHGHSHAEHGHDEHGHDDHGHDEHGHDEHGHDEGAHDVHVEEMGPNKGHIVRLEPTDYMAEWRHYKGNSVIRIYVLDSNKKTVAVDGIVSVKSESGKSKETFELVPEDADDTGKTGVFMLDEQALANAMNLGVVIKFEIDGKVYSGKVPPHAPHHH